MLLRLDKVDESEEAIMRVVSLESKLPCLLTFLGMPYEGYFFTVRSQIELALGRYEKYTCGLSYFIFWIIEC